MSASVSTGPVNPRRYHEAVDAALSPVAAADPVCLYLETTNRCNLLCTTCPRTYADLEPEADMSWELFTRIVDQVPNIARVVLHGVGEPMLVRDLPHRIRYLKERGIYVLFNTNGTALTPRKGSALIESGSTSCASRSMRPTRPPSSRCAARGISTVYCATSAPLPRCRCAKAPSARACRCG
jgi:uncharacterized radical SAM superfamily Fe-S cluster-containing enzyme